MDQYQEWPTILESSNKNNNCHCIAKYFSIDRHGIDHAKVMAIESRRELEEQYGYIGD